MSLARGTIEKTVHLKNGNEYRVVFRAPFWLEVYDAQTKADAKMGPMLKHTEEVKGVSGEMTDEERIALNIQVGIELLEGCLVSTVPSCDQEDIPQFEITVAKMLLSIVYGLGSGKKNLTQPAEPQGTSKHVRLQPEGPGSPIQYSVSSSENDAYSEPGTVTAK